MNIDLDINGILFLVLVVFFVLYWIGLAFHETHAEYTRYIRRQKKQLLEKKKQK